MRLCTCRLFSLKRSKRLLKTVLRESRVPLNIRLQVSRTDLPIIRCLADAAGEEDDLVCVGWGEH